MAPREPESTDWQVNYPEIKMRSAHLLRSGEWADCSFQFESGAGEAAPSLAAHRLILAMASPVFAAMFYGRVGDKEEPIHISDIDHAVFSSMLDYIYTDEVEITGLEMASELFRAANKYILVHLERKCINYLLETLFFRTNTLDVIKANTFKDAQLETLKTIYSLDTLSINSELDLFEALVEYTKTDTEMSDNGPEINKSHERNTVRRWIRRYEETGDVNCERRGPRPIAYTNENSRHREIVSLHSEDPFKTTRSTASLYDISLYTVRRHLHAAGIHNYKPAKKIPLTEEHRQARIRFATEYLNFDWEGQIVIFTDEKCFKSDDDGRKILWRRRGERYNPENMVPLRTSGRISLGYWGWMSMVPGELVEVGGRMNSEKYIEILRDVLVPSDNKVLNGENQQVRNETDLNEKSTDTTDLNNKHQDETEKKRKVARTRIMSVMEKIRFLTIPPEKFAETACLYVLFSEEEIFALTMNSISKKALVPIPAGFSTSRIPRRVVSDQVIRKDYIEAAKQRAAERRMADEREIY
ncbi:BTB/POZ domain-containing protein [Phthorimaea operculella]|nr:BTB/POZ domain-containing protein [Phthorimaea operculella]